MALLRVGLLYVRALLGTISLLISVNYRMATGVHSAIPSRGGLPCATRILNSRRKEQRMKNVIMRLWKEEEGQDLVEYILLVVLVALGAIAGMSSLATALNKAFSSASVNMT